MLSSSFAFSWMVILTKLAGRGCTWQEVAFARALLPLLFVAAWARWAGVRLVLFGPPVLWLRSVAGSCSLIGTFFALSRLPGSDVYTLSQLFPIWVALLAWPMLGEWPNGSVWLAIACSLAGVFVIGSIHADNELLATSVVVAVSLFTALAMIGLHKLHWMDTRAVVVHFSLVSLLFASVAYLVFQSTDPADERSVWHLVELLGVGIMATVGQLCLTKAFTTGDPTRLAVVSLVQVVFVLVLEILILQTPPEDWSNKLLGMPLIILPTAWLMLRRRSAQEEETLPQDTSVVCVE